MEQTETAGVWGCIRFRPTLLAVSGGCRKRKANGNFFFEVYVGDHRYPFLQSLLTVTVRPSRKSESLRAWSSALEVPGFWVLGACFAGLGVWGLGCGPVQVFDSTSGSLHNAGLKLASFDVQILLFLALASFLLLL